MTLESDDEVLDEVVVVGYGRQKKKESVVGAISTVDVANLKVPKALQYPMFWPDS